jgi:hypothetical protein
MELLNYRAGAKALEILRARGLSPSDLQSLVLPAIGPKWLVLAGFDRALLEQGWLDANGHRRLLFGSSVGAWRALAMASREPLRAHAALVHSYCNQRFTHDDDPRAISDAYRRLICDVFSDADLAHAMCHPLLDIAIATVRARGLLTVDGRIAQGLALGTATLLNAISSKTQRLFFERVIFDTRADAGRQRSVSHHGVGLRAVLNAANARDVALASGTVPMYMQLIRNIAHAPRGAYLDGGFSDYHVNQRLHEGDGISLLFLHQSRIVPSWLDKFVPWRGSRPEALSRLLLVHPTSEFVRSLPGAAVPTREDFKRFVDQPDVRIERWHAVVAQSAQLGAGFLQDVARGAIASRVQPL